MKKLFSYLLFILVSSSFAFSQECDETMKARMIKQGLSDETIAKECDNAKEETKISKESEEVEKVDKVSKITTNHLKPYQAQVILVSSLGSGISLYYNFKEDIWFGIDSQSTSGSAEAKTSTGTYKYKLDLNFSTTYLNARYYLVESMPSFFLQGGLVSRNWTLMTVETRVSDNQKVGTYKTKYPNSALNIGLGWNWINEQGFSGGIHFIALIGGSPLHTYEMESGWTCSDTCKANYEEAVDDLPTNGTAHINLGYNFNF